ncbi:DUF2946 family protein [Aliivibrio kagoshimensis]|uniref:DUF2946 family protein n=1 Tax=Aliivibrio kagoshimensis TaxID=2910230 RepID=UPI003D0B57F7
MTLLAFALSWLLIISMPVINAHSAAAGHWETICTVKGFQLIQVDQSPTQPSHSIECPFSHYISTFSDTTPTFISNVTLSLVITVAYHSIIDRTRYLHRTPRAPPSIY